MTGKFLGIMLCVPGIMITAQNSAQIFPSGVDATYIQQKLLSMHLNRPFHGFLSVLLMDKLGNNPSTPLERAPLKLGTEPSLKMIC